MFDDPAILFQTDRIQHHFPDASPAAQQTCNRPTNCAVAMPNQSLKDAENPKMMRQTRMQVFFAEK